MRERVNDVLGAFFALLLQVMPSILPRELGRPTKQPVIRQVSSNVMCAFTLEG